MKLGRSFALNLLILFQLTAVVAAGDSFVFIVDGSGSMWGQIDGKAKITIAKDVLINLVSELPEDTQVGLFAYGHRHEGDCSDVEELVPIGPIKKDIIVQKIQAISPKGKTPLARSVQYVAESLKTNGTTIVLVSDGKETCASDPCALVQKLKETKSSFVLHVVGFDVTEEERGQLECLAKAGNGKYFTANSAKELLFVTRQIAEFNQPKVPPQGTGRVWFDTEDPSIAAGTSFVVHFEADSRFHENAWLGIVPASIPHGDETVNDEHDVYYRYLYGRTAGEETLVAPSSVGDYTVRLHNSADNGQEVASVDFKVVPAKAEIWLDSSEIFVANPLKVHFKSTTGLGEQAWIGLVPSGVQHGLSSVNDEFDVGYSYVSGTEGEVEITGPAKPGMYDARLHDTTDEGIEIAAVSFRVNGIHVEAKLSKTTYSVNEPIIVTYSASGTLSPTAWAGIVPTNVPHVDEATNDENDLIYLYLNQGTTLTFSYGLEPGKYDIRFNDNDNDGNEIGSVSFTVVK